MGDWRLRGGGLGEQAGTRCAGIPRRLWRGADDGAVVLPRVALCLKWAVGAEKVGWVNWAGEARKGGKRALPLRMRSRSVRHLHCTVPISVVRCLTGR